jgi:hypothetical protein
MLGDDAMDAVIAAVASLGDSRDTQVLSCALRAIGSGPGGLRREA